MTKGETGVNPAPQIHDTALFVPDWQVEGVAAIAVSNEVEIGLRGSYAAYEWSSASAAGTMPLPSKPGTWGVGPELRLALPLDDQKRFTLGIAANVTNHHVPYAEWTLTGPDSPNGVTTPCVPSRTCIVSGAANYQLHDEKSESHLTYMAGLYPSFSLAPEDDRYGHVFGILAATNGFGNDGFTNVATNGSTIRVTGPLWMVGGGYGMSIDWVRFAGSIYVPLVDKDSAVDYGIGFQLTLGVNLELWETNESRRPVPAPAPTPPPERVD
jgi:hypothetical protein